MKQAGLHLIYLNYIGGFAFGLSGLYQAFYMYFYSLVKYFCFMSFNGHLIVCCQMCDILFSQLCLRVPRATAMPYIDDGHQNDKRKETDSRFSNPLDYETASMAALLLRGNAIVPMQLVASVPAALFYWPLIQLAGAATDNIALGVAVGSKGRGNLPGATSDIRATLLLLLIGKCTDPVAFEAVGGEEFFR